MEATAPPIDTPPHSLSAPSRLASLTADAVLWLLAFSLTTYLALSGGGYDIVPRSDMGLVIWWLLLLGLIVGVLPRTRISRSTWIALIPLSGFFAWTWLGTGWTKDQELTLVEFGRVATYGGAFMLGACLLNRRSVRTLLYGVAAGIAVVSGLAVLSKLLPSFFPRDVTAHYYATTRLRYPFDYSDGVGEFAALGIPLLLSAATGARSVWARAVSAGALPVVLLCLAMTVSRGGILAAAIGTIVFLALSPDRLARVVTGLLAAVGTLVLLVALLARKGLTTTMFGAAPASQRHSMLGFVVVVAIAVGAGQAALALAGRRWTRPGWTIAGPRAARATGIVIAAVVLAAVAALFITGAAHHLWTQFKQPSAASNGNSYFRLLSVAGSHRYQYWQVALHAFQSSPWHGIGPGTFQYYWLQHQTLGEYVLNAHSLWMESLAELGIIGLALLAGFFLFVLVAGAVRSLQCSPDARLLRAASVASVSAFCAAAAFDWVWQIAAVPMVTMLLCAICTSSSQASPRQSAHRSYRGYRLRLPIRLVLIAISLVALWTIVVPFATTTAVRRSQAAAGRGQLEAALRDAANAQQLEPAAASPRLQQALILEQLNHISAAAAAIGQAEARSPTDWQIWLVASRIAAEQNRPREALRDYLRARSLNPRSPIFGG